MTELERMAQMDFETAYRIARARGMAERSRIAGALFRQSVRAVRSLFSQPAGAGKACES